MVSIPTRPMTQADVDALRARGRELSNQLRSAQGRRDDLAKQLRSAQDGVSSTGIEQRLQVLDARLAQIENDIAANGRQLAAAPPAMLQQSTSDAPAGNNGRPFSSGQLTAISIVMTLAVFMPIAMATARAILKRSTVQKPSPQILESSARIERMEQAIDAIAVEIERISEGQRFVTQTLAKRTEVPVLREGEAPV